MPLTDLPEHKLSDVYIYLRFYPGNDHTHNDKDDRTLIFSLKYGTIYEPQHFTEIFGPCQELNLMPKISKNSENSDKTNDSDKVNKKDKL